MVDMEVMTTMIMKRKSYSELIKLKTFDARFNYLKLSGSVGADTFGFARFRNQKFYQSTEWRNFRNRIITRDMGCDLGIEGREIHGPITLHHINPITLEDIENNSVNLLDPENIICVSLLTHNAIHYSDENILPKDPVERRPNDTCPWKK